MNHQRPIPKHQQEIVVQLDLMIRARYPLLGLDRDTCKIMPHRPENIAI